MFTLKLTEIPFVQRDGSLMHLFSKSPRFTHELVPSRFRTTGLVLFLVSPAPVDQAPWAAPDLEPVTIATEPSGKILSIGQ